jgi:tetratricopeptide (TPR) repeat protein
LRTLESKNAEWVAKHLVMAGRLLDEDPELAFQHALAASRRGGRMAPVREAVGLTAYAAGHYGEALREFRTFRRISGSNEHLPIMADCERGLGRPDRALELTRSEDAESLDTAGKVELAIVASGARSDLQQFDAAVAALEIPQLDRNRAFSYSPRLFRAYADALEAANRGDEAQQWRRQAAVAENALGVGDFAEPEIVDLVGEETEPVDRPRQGSGSPAQERTDAMSEEPEDAAEAAASDSEPAEAGEAGPSSEEEVAPSVSSPTDEPKEEHDAAASIEPEEKDAPATVDTPVSRDDDA